MFHRFAVIAGNKAETAAPAFDPDKEPIFFCRENVQDGIFVHGQLFRGGRFVGIDGSRLLERGELQISAGDLSECAHLFDVCRGDEAHWTLSGTSIRIFQLPFPPAVGARKERKRRRQAQRQRHDFLAPLSTNDDGHSLIVLLLDYIQDLILFEGQLCLGVLRIVIVQCLYAGSIRHPAGRWGDIRVRQ